jgi:hypothetical protein
MSHLLANGIASDALLIVAAPIVTAWTLAVVVACLRCYRATR